MNTDYGVQDEEEYASLEALTSDPKMFGYVILCNVMKC
jgi:hypothetical protein